MGVLNDFKTFLLRGNVIDLAVAVVMGAAFTGVVNALVRDLMTPLIAAIFGKPDFSQLTFTIHGSRFLYGDLINFLVSFLLTGTAIYFLIVLPVNTLMARARTEAPPDSSVKKCTECLSDIPAAARRCAYCTSEQTPAAA